MYVTNAEATGWVYLRLTTMHGSVADVMHDARSADYAGESFVVSREKFKLVQWQTSSRLLLAAGNIVDPSRYNGREWAVRQQWRLGVQVPEGRVTSCLPPASPPLVSFSDGQVEVSRVLDVGFVLDVVVRSLCSRLSEPDLQSFCA